MRNVLDQLLGWLTRLRRKSTGPRETLDAYCADCGGRTILRNPQTFHCWCPECQPAE